MFCAEVDRAHQMTKLGSFFFKAYCLSEKEVPPVCHSTMVACLQQVSTRSPTGAKGKSTELAKKMEKFWDEKFSKIYPERVEAEGRSLLRSAVAEQLTSCTLNNTTMHFESRCRRLCKLLGVDSKRSDACIRSAFVGKWDLVDEEVREPLRRVLPSDPAKGSVLYDLKKRSSEYVTTTYRLCKEITSVAGGRDICFAPLHTSCIPRHVKIDTETLAQIVIPHREAVQARKDATTRLNYNDFIWNKILNSKVVDGKLKKGFHFHHEITTDGYSVSILYSRPKRASGKTKRIGKHFTWIARR